MLFLIGERVIEFRFAAHDEQSPATEAPALGDDHAFRTAFGDLDFGSDGVGLA